MGGYRAKMYNFRLTGLPHYEHVANYKLLDAKKNSDDKVVTIGEDRFLGNKAIEIAFKDFHEAPANPSGTDPWYMAKNSFATWTINVDKAIEGAQIYFSLECSSTTHIARHLFNEAKYNEAHPDAPVALPGQSPDTVEEDDWRYAVAVGETNYPMKNNNTLGESGVKEINKQYYVYFTDINLASGANVIKLTQCNMGYRMRFNQNVRIVYNTDATITGEHAHVFNQLVSETEADCQHEGQQVWKCQFDDETYTVTTPKGDHVAEGVDFTNSQGKTGKKYTCSKCGHVWATMDLMQADATGDIGADGKLVNNKEFTWRFKLGEAQADAGQIKFSMTIKKGSGNATINTGYSVKINGVDAEMKFIGAAINSSTAALFEVAVGTAEKLDENGEIVVVLKTPASQNYRPDFRGDVRIDVEAAAE